MESSVVHGWVCLLCGSDLVTWVWFTMLVGLYLSAFYASQKKNRETILEAICSRVQFF